MKWNRDEFLTLVTARRDAELERRVAQAEQKRQDRIDLTAEWLEREGPRMDELAARIRTLRGPKKNRIVYSDDLRGFDLRGAYRSDHQLTELDIDAMREEMLLTRLIKVVESSSDDVISSSAIESMGFSLRALIQ